MARLVVLASGGGSNLQAVMDAPDLPGRVVGVVCNKHGAYAIERAQRAGIPCEVVARREVGGSREDFDRALADRVAAFAPDLIVMAGFMHVVSPAFLDRFPGDAIVNLHPAWLPDDPAADRVTLPNGYECPVWRGHNAVEQAVAAGARWTGTSVHFVTRDVDRGPLIAREAVEVRAGDTVVSLQARIQGVEHRLLPGAIAGVLRERGFGSVSPRPAGDS